MACLPLAALLALLLAQYGETVTRAEMVEGTPVLTTSAAAGGWTRIAVIGPIGCVIDEASSEPAAPEPPRAPERGA